MLPPKNKSFLIWCAGISVALICLVIVLPTLLFKFYPYSIVLTMVYGAVTVLFTLLYFRLRKNLYKIISFMLYSVPVVTLIVVLISIQIGWIPYP
mgnify:FL=1